MFASIFEFFALGTLGFYILLGVLSILFITCVENEHYISPTIISLVLATVYWKALYALRLDWRAVIIGVVVYVVVGVLWAFFRWKRHIRKLTEEYMEDGITDLDRKSLKNSLKFSENKARIGGWLAYWPWSLLWNITGDFFKMVSEALQGVFEKMAEKAIANIPTKSGK